MIPTKIKDANRVVGVDQAGVRPVWLRDGPGIKGHPEFGTSAVCAFAPTQRELDILNAGGVVLLEIVAGGQWPPVLLTCEEE